jgi:NAD(P)-dependent dehydrogenase (short-subunit alcohol dehydrogenase family)
MVCRNRAKGEAAQEAIRSLAANSAVDLFIADLGSQADIAQLIDEVGTAYDQLDVLVNNAGVVLISRETSADGYELTLATNHLAPYQLTVGLIDRLKDAGESRVVTVSSAMHTRAQIHFDDRQLEQKYGWMRAYGQSKLANVLFAGELSKRTAGSGIVSTSMHPGGVATNFGKANGGLGGALWRVFTTLGRPVMRSPRKGAETVVWLAESPDALADTGAYFVDRKVKQPSARARDPETARRLWEVSAELTGVDLPA